MNEPKIVFGTIIIDKLHHFFGTPNPRACIVASAWESEEDDGEDTEVWIDHYRGHFKKTYADLRDKNKWEVLNKRIDPSKNVLEQLEEIESHFQQEQEKE